MSLHHRDPLGEKRYRAAAVSDDEPDIRTALDSVCVNQVHNRPGRIEHILDDERWRAQAGVLRRFAVSWVNEYHRLAPVELIENRIERRIAQVTFVHAGKKSDAVET